MGIIHTLTLLLYISYGFALFSEAANTITQGQLVRDGETIVSSGQIFVLGFFSPANSTSRYVGIWYNRVSLQTVVWVANRDRPVSGKDGVLTIGDDGNLLVLDGNGTSVWSSNASAGSQNSTAMLMDTGDLLLSSNGSSTALWQSFGNPTDTFLPGMRVEINQTGENHIFTSWKSVSDPSTGNYSMGIDSRGSPQIVIWEGSKRRWRSGHWNGLVFLGVPITRSFYFNGFQFSNGADGEMYMTYTTSSSNETLRFQLWWDGYAEQLIWNQTTEDWGVLQLHPDNHCEVYNKCGAFGECGRMDSPVCNCIEGFEPENSDEWNKGNCSGGCIRRTSLQCGMNGTSDGFLTVEGVKLPDFADTFVAESTEDCKEKCLKNCSCNAYAFVVGIPCMMWSLDLIDVEHIAEGGSTLYVRLADSELGSRSRLSTAQTISIVVAVTIVLGVFIWLLWRFRAKLKDFLNSLCNKNELPTFRGSESVELSTDFSGPDGVAIEGKQGSGPELPLFDFNNIAAATNYFANNNKLGQGGFGPVYKGMLPGGQEIAVKRLSRCSGQGLEEFKNEIIMIAKLQHRNLVRLLGCCIQGEERLLIYEYMPNNSLDSFLFVPAKQSQLDWSKRFSIIEGIARGLLYLHRDSRLRIIHRDLKASNILLDEEMKPKISDFGMARIFGGNQNEANTNRVVGTYGYMSPEYAMEGLFSVKSDVYSFGVLLLEIVSGQRNTSFRSHECLNLIRYAWNHWDDGKAMELIDPRIADSCRTNEVLRCIHVAMLCVQDSAVYRPTMSSVVLMLESEAANLPVPRQPTFSSMRSHVDRIHLDLGIEEDDTSLAADVEITEVIGR